MEPVTDFDSSYSLGGVSMYSMRSLLFSFLWFSSLIFAELSTATEINQGMMLSNSCAACHGAKGKSPGAIPSINGKSAKFLFESLKEFQTGARPSTVMGRHAKGYSDEELRLIAEYFSKQ